MKKAAFHLSRFFFVLLLAVGFWMADCSRPTSLQTGAKNPSSPEEKASYDQILRGCSRPEMPANAARSLAELATILPLESDRDETQSELNRDFVFMGSYTLAYLALACLMCWRPSDAPAGAGRNQSPARVLAPVAMVLALVTLCCDIGENWHTLQAMDELDGDYIRNQESANEPLADHGRMWSYEKWYSAFVLTPLPDAKATAPTIEVNDGQRIVDHGRMCSYGKWYSAFLLMPLLAFAFLQPRRFWPNVAGGLLLLGGIAGLISTTVFVRGGSGRYLEYSFLTVLGAGFIATVLLLWSRSPEALWGVDEKDQPHPQVPA